MPALIVALLAAAQSQAPAARDPATAIAQRVQRHYERIQDFSARFAQTSTYPTFGNLLNASRQYLRVAPWLALFPGFTIFLLLLGFRLLGESRAEWVPDLAKSALPRAPQRLIQTRNVMSESISQILRDRHGITAAAGAKVACPTRKTSIMAVYHVWCARTLMLNSPSCGSDLIVTVSPGLTGPTPSGVPV